MEERLITYRTFNSPVEAHLIRLKLEAYEIESYIFDENIVTLNQFYNLAAGGIKLKIKEKDIEKANLILQEKINKIEDDDSEIKCPKCNSGNVSYGPATKNRFSVLNIVISFLILVYPVQTRYRYHCFNCGNEFRRNN